MAYVPRATFTRAHLSNWRSTSRLAQREESSFSMVANLRIQPDQRSKKAYENELEACELDDRSRFSMCARKIECANLVSSDCCLSATNELRAKKFPQV